MTSDSGRRRTRKKLPKLGQPASASKSRLSPGLTIEREPGIRSTSLDFLGLHCILDPATRAYYQKVYDAVDDNMSGGLDHAQLANGLKTINKQLITDHEIEYVVRILDMMQLVGVMCYANNRSSGVESKRELGSLPTFVCLSTRAPHWGASCVQREANEIESDPRSWVMGWTAHA